jgi:hypothetical protein
MKKTIMTCLLALSGFAFASDPYISIKLDIQNQTGQNKFNVSVHQAETANIRAYLYQSGVPWTPTTNYGAVFGYGFSRENSTSMVRRTGTVLGVTNYVEFAMSKTDLNTNGNFFAQVMVTNTTSEWVFNDGMILIQKNPIGSASSAPTLYSGVDYALITFQNATNGPLVAGSNVTFRSVGSRGQYAIDVSDSCDNSAYSNYVYGITTNLGSNVVSMLATETNLGVNVELLKTGTNNLQSQITTNYGTLLGITNVHAQLSGHDAHGGVVLLSETGSLGVAYAANAGTATVATAVSETQSNVFARLSLDNTYASGVTQYMNSITLTSGTTKITIKADSAQNSLLLTGIGMPATQDYVLKWDITSGAIGYEAESGLSVERASSAGSADSAAYASGVTEGVTNAILATAGGLTFNNATNATTLNSQAAAFYMDLAGHTTLGGFAADGNLNMNGKDVTNVTSITFVTNTVKMLSAVYAGTNCVGFTLAGTNYWIALE